MNQDGGKIFSAISNFDEGMILLFLHCGIGLHFLEVDIILIWKFGNHQGLG